MDSYELDDYLKPYCNWGRWGADDELGTFNFINPQMIVDACKLVTNGKVFSLAMPFDKNCSYHLYWILVCIMLRIQCWMVNFRINFPGISL